MNLFKTFSPFAGKSHLGATSAEGMQKKKRREKEH
jgi:hypothetical protein